VPLTHSFPHYQDALKKRNRALPGQLAGRPSAVIAPIALLGGEESILFTKRQPHLSSHPGQICFPGGTVEDEDASLLHTALRETEEELGLREENLGLIGQLDKVWTITGFTITPFLAEVRHPEKILIQQEEIAEVFWVPVKDLLNPANYREQSMKLTRGFSYDMQTFTVSDPPVWGATARIIRNLLSTVHGWEDPHHGKP
jgi:8-oxo-dGTP pyrophosphatase MutT (NUDIX family)